MFVYSLAGLTIEGQDSQEAVELPDNATTSRTGVYQLLAQLVGPPDKDVHAAAVAGEWPTRLAEAGKLVPFAVDYGKASIPASMSPEEFQAEYLRVFEVGEGTGGPPAPLYGGFYGNGGNRIQRLEEVVRFYEYFGLRASPEDPRPADNLSTELEFMKYLTFKEAVTQSPRLQGSFRRAQNDFLERQLTTWLPQVVERADAANALPFWKWAMSLTRDFATADAGYVSGVLA